MSWETFGIIIMVLCTITAVPLLFLGYWVFYAVFAVVVHMIRVFLWETK